MKKTTGIGMTALALSLFIAPANVNAAGTSTYCPTGNSNKVIIWNSNCDTNDFMEQLQNHLNGIFGNQNGNNNSGNNNTNDSDTQNPNVSSYAQKVVELVNVERAKEDLSPLTLDLTVTQAANVRAKEIQSNFSHTRPNGSSFYSVLSENGVSYRGSGENIAYGQRTPEQVVTGWMNSTGHRANIMNKNFKNIGVGYQVNNGTAYWVQLFTY